MVTEFPNLPAGFFLTLGNILKNLSQYLKTYILPLSSFLYLFHNNTFLFSCYYGIDLFCLALREINFNFFAYFPSSPCVNHNALFYVNYDFAP